MGPLGVLASLAIGIAPGPGAEPPPPCHRSGERLIAVSGGAAVLRRGADVLGCDRRTGRRVLVYRPPPPEPNVNVALDHVAVSHSTVVFSVFTLCTTCGPGSHVVRVRDLQSRDGQRTLREIHEPLPEGWSARVRALAVNDCETVGIVSAARAPASGRDHSRELRLWTREGVRMVDDGRIEVASLRVTDTNVLWRRDGVTRRRRLPTTCSHPAASPG